MRIGHAGLVTDGKNNRVLQATEYGALSKIGYVTNFTNRINFMVLRPKASSEIKSQVIQYAKEHLIGLPYNVFVGANYKQNEIKESLCAHIVWFAYHKFGYELLDKKKTFVLPYDLANSDKIELVQVFGFDLNRLWDKIMF